MGSAVKVEDSLNALDRVLVEIKTFLSASKGPCVVELRGLLKGMRIARKDVEEAEKSLFKHGTN